MLLDAIKNYKKTFIFLVIVVLYLLSWLVSFDNNNKYHYGITFSQMYATHLGLDWQETFLATLDDLKVQDFRLIAYWNLIEIEPGIYDFTDLDWQVNEVEKRGGNIVLSLGLRVPRWPECHVPTWATKIPTEQLYKENNKFIEAVIRHYANNKSISLWQIENEPFLTVFGECPLQSEAFVAEKIANVKMIANKPIATTDSGELGSWLPTARISDWLGISIYRRVQQPIVGYINYPLPPLFYSLKTVLVKIFEPNKKVYISELQLEPWISNGIIGATIAEQKAAMPENNVANFVMYARKTGLDPIYFWGAEWWYYMKQKGETSYWTTVKRLIEENANKQ